MHESQFGLLVSAGIALFLSLIAHTTVCAEQHECLRRGTCYSLNSGSALDPSCSFRTTVTPAGYKLLNTSVQYETMQSMGRGVCSPGLRQQVDALTGHFSCVRKRSWPDALLEEIGDPSADTDHGRYCGKWIDAGSIAYGDRKWAWFDAEDTEQDVDNVVRAKGASRMATTDLGKFRSSCRTMVASNSAGASAKQAYDLLAPSLRTDSLGVALESVGFLASHYCDAPALVGIGMDDNRFVTKVLEGVALGDQDLRNAMYVVGEDRAARNDARDFGTAMRELASTALDETDRGQAGAVVRGSYAGTWLAGYVGTTLPVARELRNDPLGRFVAAYRSHGPAKAHAYLRGVAAVCSLAARSMVSLEEGNLIPFFSQQTQTGLAASRTAAALGRLVAPQEDHDDVNITTVSNASAIRLSSLSALSSASRSSAREVCLAAAKRVFPDEFDRIAFNALVTPALYERLRALSDAVREASAQTLSRGLIGAHLRAELHRTDAVSKIGGHQAAHRRRAARHVGGHRPRVPAARSSTSTTRRSRSIVKQARAVFLDRLLPVVTRRHLRAPRAVHRRVAQRVPAAASTSACAMLLPGLLVPPFADERYDDASLATRRGLRDGARVHARDGVPDAVERAYADSLLARYPSSTRWRPSPTWARRRAPRALPLRHATTRSARRSRSSSAGAWAGCPCWTSRRRRTRPQICGETTCARFYEALR